MGKGLGMFSMGLGLTQLLAPDWLGARTGTGQHRTLMRALGTRELASGIGALRSTPRPFALWARVAGDVMDLALLTGALRRAASRPFWSRWTPFSMASRAWRRTRIIGSLAMVAGVTVADLIAARRAWAARANA